MELLIPENDTAKKASVNFLTQNSENKQNLLNIEQTYSNAWTFRIVNIKIFIHVHMKNMKHFC